MSTLNENKQLKTRRTFEKNTFVVFVNWFKKNQNVAFISTLLLIAIFSHLAWFIPGTTLFHADWKNWPEASVRELWRGLGTWSSYNNFGSIRPEIGFSFVLGLWSVLSHIGIIYNNADKITLLIPLAILGFIAPYIFVRKLTGKNFISFVAALFYGSTTYFLGQQATQVQILIVYALSPLIFYFFIRALESLSIFDGIIFSLLFAIGMAYEVRIAFILVPILLLYMLMLLPLQDKKKLLRLSIFCGILLLLLGCYWIFPTYLGGTTSSINSLTSRNLFGSWLFDLPHAIALSAAGWTGASPNDTFTLQPIFPYLFFIPFVAILPLTITGQLSRLRQKQIIYFLVVLLFGIFLTKMTQAPLSGAYQWSYTHLPGFSLFREASKFYLVTALGYLGLIAIGLISLKNAHTNIFYLATIGIVVLSLVNLYPLFTGKIGGVLTARHMPQAYNNVNKLISIDTNYSRSLWVPLTSNWTYFNSLHPALGGVYQVQGTWGTIFPLHTNQSIQQQLTDAFNTSYMQKLVGKSAIKYVIVPTRDIANEDDVFPPYGNDRQYYVDVLSSIPWLKKVNVGTSQIAVYENTHYTPYVSGVGSVYTISKQNEIPGLLPIINKWFGGDFDITKNNNQPQAGEGTFKQLFDPQTADPNGKEELTQTLDVPAKTSLYVNKSSNDLAYKIYGGSLTVNSLANGGLKMNGQAIDPASQSSQTVGQVATAANTNYYIGTTKQLQYVNPAKTGMQKIGSTSSAAYIYRQSPVNLIKDPSFETGLWQPKVKDCNHYDNNGLVAMKRSGLASAGKYSLQLESYNHIACTGQWGIPVTPGATYSFNFSYRNQGGQKAGYKIEFNDPKHTVVRQDLQASSNSRRTLLRSVTVPAGATDLALKVYGYQDENGNNDSLTYYDNFGLNLLQPVLTIPPPDAAVQKIPLPAGQATFTYRDKNYPMKNLIKNGSFRRGLWQSQVGDCNNYDDNPQISMSTYPNGSDNSQALQLEASAHTACTGPNSIKVSQNGTYLLSFDYQSPDGASASYYVSYDDPGGSSVSKTLTETGAGWHHYSVDLSVPAGATHLNLTVYAAPHGSNNAKSIVRYDNFKLVQIPDILSHYYVVTQPATKVTPPKHISYTLISPTKKTITVTGATTPFYLAMSESYDPKWRLELDNARVSGALHSWLPGAVDAVPASDHIDLNDFENGWYVDPAAVCKDMPAGCTKNPDGSYNLQLVAEFTPQRWFYVGSIISGLTFLACISYLGYIYWPKRTKSSKRSHYKIKR